MDRVLKCKRITSESVELQRRMALDLVFPHNLCYRKTFKYSKQKWHRWQESQESKWISWMTCSKYWHLLWAGRRDVFLFPLFIILGHMCWLAFYYHFQTQERPSAVSGFRLRWRLFSPHLSFSSNKASERKLDNATLTRCKKPGSLKSQFLSSDTAWEAERTHLYSPQQAPHLLSGWPSILHPLSLAS